MMASPHLIGIGAGVVAAVLFASLATNTTLIAVMFYVIPLPLPLLLARLGWGRVAGQLAVSTAVVLVGIIISLKAAITYGVVIALPALMLAHLVLLSRTMVPEDPEGRPLPQMPSVIEWYPPGHVIAWTAVIAGSLAATAFLLLAGDAEAYHQGVRKAFVEVVVPQLQAAGLPLDALRAERYAAAMSRLVLPAAAAICWMLVMLLNVWGAAKITSISGQLPRPWPTFANLEYPPMMTVGFVASVGAALLPGMPGIMAMTFVGAFGLAYLVLGLIVLHQVIGQTPFRPLLLAGLYAMLIVDWAVLLIALIGLAEPFLELRQRVLRRSAPPPKGGKT